MGEAGGVRAERRAGALVIVFTPRAARLYRRVAGRRVSVLCTELPHPDDRGLVSINSGGVTMRAPKRRRPLRTGDRTADIDFCDVSLPPRTVREGSGRTRRPRRTIVSIPLTQRGAVYLDERSKTLRLLVVLSLAAAVMERQRTNDYPTAPELAQVTAGLRVVPLATPADTPPAGRVGYFSNARDHVAVVIVSASGRRLFIELAPDRVLHTNVGEYGFGP